MFFVQRNLMLNDKSDFFDRSKKNTDEKIDLRSGVPRLVTQDREKKESKTEVRKHVNSNVTIGDVKSTFRNLKILFNFKLFKLDAALYMLSKRYYIPDEFENYCK